MMEVQFCESFTRLPGADMSHARVEFSAEEAVYALHNWHRQLQWHNTITRASPADGNRLWEH